MDVRQLAISSLNAFTTFRADGLRQNFEHCLENSAYAYQVSNCVRSKRIYVQSADTLNWIPIQSRCNKCYYCKNTKKNEWVTRMYLETRAHKYCYFVTLHYKPFSTADSIPDVVSDACWHYDDKNKWKSLAWHPCVVRLEHHQYFIRNLRNDCRAKYGSDSSIRFVVSFEYGSTYGRPHMHYVLWSDHKLTKYDIIKAWSVRKGRKSMSISPLDDKVDFNDLNANGTLAGCAMVDGKSMSAKNCFKYVAKYVVKGDRPNMNRVKLFWHDSLFGQSDLCYVNYDKLLNARVKKLLSDMQSRAPENFVFDYGKNEFCESDFSRLVVVCSSDESLCEFFRPFINMSRAGGVGMFYAKENIRRFQQNNFRLPETNFGSLVFPSAFMRKVKEFENGFTICKYDRLKEVYSFVRSKRPLLLNTFRLLPFLRVSDYADEVGFVLTPSREEFIISYFEKYLSNSTYVLRDAWSCSRMLIILSPLDNDLHVYYFNYDRHLRRWLMSRDVHFSDFLAEFSKACDSSLLRAQRAEAEIYTSYKALKMAEKVFSFGDGASLSSYLLNALQQADTERESNSFLYQLENFGRVDDL